MLHLYDHTTGVFQVDKKHAKQPKIRDQDYLWKMCFDGSSCQEGA